MGKVALKEKGLDFQFDIQEGDLNGTERLRHDFDINGIWLELSVPMTVGDCYGVSVGFSHLFPFETNSSESYILTGPEPASREWDNDIQWWNIETAGTYKITCNITMLGGFRWTSFMNNFTDPFDSTVVQLESDQADITYSAYIPFVGLQGVWPVSCNSILRATVIGTPIYWAHYEYKESIIGNNARISSEGDIADGRFIEATGVAPGENPRPT